MLYTSNVFHPRHCTVNITGVENDCTIASKELGPQISNTGHLSLLIVCVIGRRFLLSALSYVRMCVCLRLCVLFIDFRMQLVPLYASGIIAVARAGFKLSIGAPAGAVMLLLTSISGAL